MPTKRAVYEAIEFKADDSGQPGDFKALVSVFGNVDVQGDRVMPGAFKNDLTRWKASGDPIPVIWNHDWANPAAHIGYVDPRKAFESEKGLVMPGHIDIDDDNPFAKQVYKLLNERRVKNWSFAYDVHRERRSQKDGANELLELGIIEVGPTLKGANGLTDTMSMKDAGLEAAFKTYELLHGEKAGRRISANTMKEMQDIATSLDDCSARMKKLMGMYDDEESAEGEGEGKSDDSPSVKNEENDDHEALQTSDGDQKIEAEGTKNDDREPEAKSSDNTEIEDREPGAKSSSNYVPSPEDIQLRSRIAEMRAT